jgi:hypothetical protein
LLLPVLGALPGFLLVVPASLEVELVLRPALLLLLREREATMRNLEPAIGGLSKHM